MKNIFQYDLHTHTSFSDGRNDLLTMLQSAESYGMAGMVFTDHAFSDVEAERLWTNYHSNHLPASKVKILFGTETTVADLSGKPVVSADILRKFDLVLMDCNGILFRQLAELKAPENIASVFCNTLINACSIPEITILAHPLNCGLPPLNLSLERFTNEMLGNLADAFVRHGKVFEIMNQMYYWHTTTSFEQFHSEYSRIVQIMKEAGVRFSLGSDSHSCCGIGNFSWAHRIVEEQKLYSDFFLPEAFAENLEEDTNSQRH